MGRQRRTAWALTAAMIATLGLPTTAAAADPGAACPEILGVEELAPGMTGTGLTVSRGTTPEAFDVEIVDVLDNALAPGVPLIVVEADSPELDRVGGIWAGMSGSPVYVDGKLIGAVGYGFSFGPSKLGGVTPAAAMQRVGDRSQPAAASAEDEVRMSAQVREHAADAEGLSAAQAGTMRRLEVPVRVSGPTGPKLDRFITAFEDAHPGTRVVTGASGTATSAVAGDIVPGGNIGVSLAYGDYQAAGVGTVTTVCDGVVTAFGHPMLFSGATRFGMHPASAVRVVDDPVFGPYKLANVGEIAGTVDQDRLAAVAGRLGELPPTTSIATTITNRDEGRTVQGRTEAVWPEDLFGAMMMHGWIQYDSLVFDDLYFGGTSAVNWTIDGRREDGRTFSVTRENHHADPYDLSSASLVEIASTLQELYDNPFEEVEITDVRYSAAGSAPYRALEVIPDRVMVATGRGEPAPASDGVAFTPGSTLRVDIPLRMRRGAVEHVAVELEIPEDAQGIGDLVITGTQNPDPFDCWFGDCPGTRADSLEEFLDEIEGRDRGDDLTISLRIDPWSMVDVEPANGHWGPVEIASTTVRLDDVVTGEAAYPAFARGGGACPVAAELMFIDVDYDSPHAEAIACAAALELVLGVSQDPPRFAPERTVRRDQAASFIARLVDAGPATLPAGDGSRFTDLDGNVHADAIRRLAAAGIVRGRTASLFDPAASVTRGQMATLLLEALRFSTGEPLLAEGGPYFEDVSGVHAPNIDAGFELGLLSGREDGTFGISRTARRGQMASLLVRGYVLQMR
jgi:hypothetical protein